jgi:hypothetical protein
MVILTTFLAPPFLRIAFKGEESVANEANLAAEVTADSVK